MEYYASGSFSITGVSGGKEDSRFKYAASVHTVSFRMNVPYRYSTSSTTTVSVPYTPYGTT